MLRFATWKIVAILSMTAFALLIIVPSLLPPGARAALIDHMPGFIPVRTIVLGLDLQGGSHVLLEVDSNEVIKTEVQNLRDDARRLLREERIPITGGIGLLPRGIQVHVNPEERDKIMPKLQQLATPIGNPLLRGPSAQPLEINDMGSGTIQVLVTDAAINDRVRRAVDQSIEVLRRRVDALGTTEPNIQRQGNDRILVEVPGLQNPEKLKEILGTTAKLEFRLIANPGEDSSNYEMLDQTDQPGKLPVEKQVMVQGEDLTDAQPGFDSRTGEPVVNFRFNIRGGQRFGEVTSANVGRLFAIVLDGKVISAPRILGPITGGSGQISGHFTVESANNLA
ncbi:MAG: protein translocase subunit SecD, partial [Methylovirgula sp.]